MASTSHLGHTQAGQTRLPSASEFITHSLVGVTVALVDKHNQFFFSSFSFLTRHILACGTRAHHQAGQGPSIIRKIKKVKRQTTVGKAGKKRLVRCFKFFYPHPLIETAYGLFPLQGCDVRIARLIHQQGHQGLTKVHSGQGNLPFGKAVPHVEYELSFPKGEWRRGLS